jgi:hypothetical protein
LILRVSWEGIDISDISILEFGVYGLIAYSSILMLIISTIRETPFTESQSLARGIYLVPGIVCALILAGSGVNITMETVDTVNLTNATNSNSTIFIETAQTSSAFILLDPVWGAVHVMIAMVMVLYVVNQILMLLGFWPASRK